jgi:hypothetical protein
MTSFDWGYLLGSLGTGCGLLLTIILIVLGERGENGN